MTESSAGLVWPLRSVGSLADKALVDEDLWEVALPSGEVKRMTLDQLDRAFQVGLIHSNSLVRQSGGSEWQTLGLLAGLDDEPATQEPATQKADETSRPSVLPPPQEEDSRETLAGLGGFLQVQPVGKAPSVPSQPPLGSRPQTIVARPGTASPQAMVSRAATLPMPSGAPPPMKSAVASTNSFPAKGSKPPPLPQSAFSGAPIQAAPIQPVTAAIPQTTTVATAAAAQSSPGPKGGSSPPPLPAGAFGSSPPPAPRVSGPTPVAASVPPLPAGAFGSSPPPAPRVSGPTPVAASVPPQVTGSSVPVVEPSPRGMARGPAGGERLANAFIVLMALATLLVILQRNGILFQLSASLGLKESYLSFERKVLGPPTMLTPRGVEMLSQTAVPSGVPATDSSTEPLLPTGTP